jgi:4-amino-4-deoxy-L-arabinose transferase-like glycosyltransferase
VQILASCLIFTQLGERDLWASHEARAAQDAQYFLDCHHWGLLRLFDGTPEYQKPPLYYWLVALAAQLHGGSVDEAAVRLPAAMAGWVTVAAVMFFLWHRGRSRAAWVAGLVLTTTHHFLSISRSGRVDMPLTCAVSLAILFAMESRPCTSGVFAAAALLLKGPVGLAQVLAVTVLCRKRFYKTSLTAGVALVLGLPWYLVVGFETNWDYWREFFWHHNWERATGSSSDLATHPMWFYLVREMIDMFPWSIVLLIAALRNRNGVRTDPEMRLGVIWFTIVMGLLSLSSFKRADYLLPAYPAAAIVIGCFADSIRIRPVHAVLLCLTVAGNIGYQFIYLPLQEPIHERHTDAEIVRRHVEPGQQIIFFRLEDHLLAWRLGKPIATVREWENLDIWVSRLNPGFILIPCDDEADWPRQLHNGTLQEVDRLVDRTERGHPRTWVLMRSHPNGM